MRYLLLITLLILVSGCSAATYRVSPSRFDKFQEDHHIHHIEPEPGTPYYLIKASKKR